MIGLTDLEVYSSIFNITEDNNIFESYKIPDEKSGKGSYEKVRDEIERELDNSDITSTDLQDDIKAPITFKEYKEQVTRRLKDAGYMNILAGYVSSVFQDFEIFLRPEIDLVEDDIRLVSNEYNSSFITYELEPGIYTFKDLFEALFNNLQPEYEASSNVIVIEIDDFTMKTKMVVIDGIIAIKFHENSFLSNILGFNSGWDYKYYNEYTSQKIVNLSSTKNIHLKCDVIDGFVDNGVRQPIL